MIKITWGNKKSMEKKEKKNLFSEIFCAEGVFLYIFCFLRDFSGFIQMLFFQLP
jgi:hypothetical protein